MDKAQKFSFDGKELVKDTKGEFTDESILELSNGRSDEEVDDDEDGGEE